MSRITTGKHMARPRGPFPKGVSDNPGGRPAQGPDRRKMEANARLLARSHGVAAVEVVAIMNDQAAPHVARIIAANAILDRGWGRPPMLVEMYDGGDVQPEEPEGSALEYIESRLVELGLQLRASEDPPSLTEGQRVADPA